MKKVQVLMSTYNGERYLEEQIDSILEQSYDNISLLVRDDGSTDGTVSILRKYASKSDKITFYEGYNLGVVHSYFDLIKHADISADYFSFSDQDDVWKPDKISRAIKMLDAKSQDKPLLYCGRTSLVNHNLEPIVATIKKCNITPSFGNALVENVCIGCTSVLNKALFYLVQEHIPEFTVMHDWWFYLTASSFGEVYFDDESYILYRQHDNNIVGTRATYYAEFKSRLRNYKGNRGKIRRQILEFARLYQLASVDEKLLNYIILAKSNLGYRFRILISKDIYRQRILDNVIFKILFVTGNI